MNSTNDDNNDGVKPNDGRDDFPSRGGRHRHGGRRFRAWKLLFIPMILAFIAIKSALVMVLWNYLIPDLFHGPTVDFVQALGLVVLAKLLTGFGRGRFGGGPWGGGFGGHHHHGGGHWRHRRQFKERWANMTDEERQKMKQAMRERCWK